MERMTVADYAARPLPENTNPPFAFSPRIEHAPQPVAHAVHPAPFLGPMAPPRPRPAPAGNTKTDPVWDIGFSTKFPRNKPAPEQPLAKPKGVAKAMDAFLSRVEEIAYLQETQHLELATTLAEMKANNIDGFSLSAAPDDMEAANIASSHLRSTPIGVFVGYEEVEVSEPIRFLLNLFGIEKAMVPVYGDMVYVANMARRIDWERFIWACGPIHRTSFTTMPDGAIGITYTGKDRDPEIVLQHKRLHKQRWLETHPDLPDGTEIGDIAAHLSHLGKPVLALMSDAERDAYLTSRMFGTEEPDPFRAAFHGDPDPKPHRGLYAYGDHRRCRATDEGITHRGCTTDGDALFAIDLDIWEWNHREDVGYAGPSGLLGLDESVIESSFVSDDETE